MDFMALVWLLYGHWPRYHCMLLCTAIPFQNGTRLHIYMDSQKSKPYNYDSVHSLLVQVVAKVSNPVVPPKLVHTR